MELGLGTRARGEEGLGLGRKRWEGGQGDYGPLRAATPQAAAAPCGSGDSHRDEVRREARPAPVATAEQPWHLLPSQPAGAVPATRSRLAAVSRRELSSRRGVPSSLVQRGANDGLDGQQLQDARAADFEARLVVHGDGRRRDHCAPER